MGKKKADVTNADMEAAGLEMTSNPETSSPLRVGAMSVEGKENSGKTAFALSASELGPVWFIAMDSGWRTVEWFRGQGRVIGMKKLLVTMPEDVAPEDFSAVAEATMPKLEELKRICRAAIDAKAYAVVIDTGGDLEELVGYGLHGKISLDVYGGEGRLKKALNGAMASLYRTFEASDTNLLVTHFLLQFKDDIYPAGWKLTNKECPYIVRCEYDYGTEKDGYQQGDPDTKMQHWVRIMKSKHFPEQQGKRMKWSRLTGYGVVSRYMLGVGEDED